MSHSKRTILSLFTAAALCLIFTLFAAASVNNTAALPGRETNNASDNNYFTWSYPMQSFLMENADGTLTRVEAQSDATVLIETFSATGSEKRSTKTIAFELPLFGGFFAGESHNYLVFGQSNPDESDSTEVLRIVQYSKSWQRVNSASVYGANTYIPFDAGSLRMTETGGKLYIHTCHEMYMSSDGYHHQANMTYVMRESDCAVVDSWYRVMNIGYGYASHSFNQFIVTDGTNVYRVDHGDAYPRGVSVTSFSVSSSVTNVSYTIPLTFSGETGANATSASIGGAALGTNNLLIAGNIDAQGDSHSYSNARNIFILSVAKTLGSASCQYITSYSDDAGITVRTPQLVKVSSNEFLLLWEEYNTSTRATVVRAARVDGSGALKTGIFTLEARLSDCQPILTADGYVTW
ncbi:MAG: hypothetical protein IJK98_02985, partial [Clostridia bacterium]|nr:hypothetical protein [Clostridia bacterium]